MLPVSGSFPLFLIALATLIKSALIISPPGGFSLAPLTFNPAGALSVTMTNEDNQNDAMLHFCQQCIASLKSSFPNPAPVSGSHGAFVGATTGMVIA
jgi:hypothetical protein